MALLQIAIIRNQRGNIVRLHLASIAGLAVAVATVAAPVAPVHAQTLGSGDYAQCTVYDKDGRSQGFDSVCLERKRAQIARLQYQQQRYNPPVAYNPGIQTCPLYANGGRGYATTFNTFGGFPGFAAAYDAPTNGRPCMPQRIVILPGLR